MADIKFQRPAQISLLENNAWKPVDGQFYTVYITKGDADAQGRLLIQNPNTQLVFLPSFWLVDYTIFSAYLFRQFVMP